MLSVILKNINMLVTREREKLLNALIFFSDQVLYPGKTKLFKLLNYLDFLHYQKTGRSVTGLQYNAWERGPVPEELYNEWKHPQQDFIQHFIKKNIDFQNGYQRQVLKPRKQFDATYFSPFELSIMECLAKQHFKENANDMSESSHFETGPWHEVYEVQQKPSEVIPYELTLLRRGNEEDQKVLDLAKEREELMSHYK